MPHQTSDQNSSLRCSRKYKRTPTAKRPQNQNSENILRDQVIQKGAPRSKLPSENRKELRRVSIMKYV